MALSNWLTRDEWNLVYFAGCGAALEGAECPNLGEQMRLGIGAARLAGYNFRGIDADTTGNYTKRVQCCGGNEAVLVEMMDGTFDRLGRALEAIEFAKCEVPQLDLSWLAEAVQQA